MLGNQELGVKASGIEVLLSNMELSGSHLSDSLITPLKVLVMLNNEELEIEGSSSELQPLPSQMLDNEDLALDNTGLTSELQSMCPVHCYRAMMVSNNPNYHPAYSSRPVRSPNQVPLAETEKEKDKAIIRWIKLQVENHSKFLFYVQSKAKLQHVSEVLTQYKIVSGMLGQMMLVDYDRSHSCMVKMDHILKALRLDSAWGKQCREILALLSWKAKHCKLSANPFVDVATLNDEGEEVKDKNKEEVLTHYPQPVGISHKQSYKQRINAIINWLDHRTPKQTAPISLQEMLQILEGIAISSQKSIFMVDFFLFLTSLYYTASARTFSLKYMRSRGFQRPALYKGDIGYMEMNDKHNAVVTVAPCQQPYNIPKQSNEKMEFNIELARIVGLTLVLISSPAGIVIGYTCSSQEFIHGLLRLHILVHHLELIELLHPDDIKYHITAGFDYMFMEETMHWFSVQFWQETDEVEIKEGDLKSMMGTFGLT
ncbi:hypothetical protein J3A83DRAFT_4190269 [Scleroderma citrinum]